MNKKWLFLIILIIPDTILAQSDQTVGIGLRAGLSYVNNVLISDPDTPGENKYRVGYHLGVYKNFRLSEKLNLAPELLFANKGYKTDNDDRVHYNYISVPILFEYRPTNKVSVQIGPEVAYLLSAKSKVNGQTVNLIDFWEGVNLDVNRIEIGLVAGAAYNFTDRLALGLRYFHGLTSVVDNFELLDIDGNFLSDVEFKNRTFQLSLAYTIR